MSEPQAVKKPSGGRERSLANLRPFVKGQSGNPSGGSKKIAAAKDKAVDHSDEALEVIIKLLKSKDDKIALAAAERILDRGLGKPKQVVETAKPRQTLDELSTDELIDELHARRDSDGASEAEEGNGRSH